MNWRDYWKEKSAGYIEGLEGPYHRNRLQMVLALMGESPIAGKALVDFGCGDGVFARLLLERGAQVAGLDIDATMVDAARRMLLPKWPATQLMLGGVEALSKLGDGS